MSPEEISRLFPDAWSDVSGERLHTYTYDGYGYLVSDFGPSGFSMTLDRHEDEAGYEVSATSGMGRETRYRVEATSSVGQRRVTTGSDGLEVHEWVDPEEKRVELPDGSVWVATYGPDPRWGMAAPILTSYELTLPSGLHGSLSVTRSVSLSEPSDPFSLLWQEDTVALNGKAWQVFYDTTAGEVTVTSPAGRVAKEVPDDRGRVVSVEAPGVAAVGLSWDDAGRLESVEQGVRRLDLEYDDRGNVDTITDGLGRTASLEHDEAGRVTAVILPDGRPIDLGYDALGNVTRVTPPSRPNHGLPRTGFGAVAGYVPPEVSEVEAAGAPSREANARVDGVSNREGEAPALPTGAVAHHYNADRQWIGETRSDLHEVTVSHGADSARLESITHPDDVTMLEYDPTTGQVSRWKSTGGTNVEWTWDGPVVTGETWSGAVAGAVAWTWTSDLQMETETVVGTGGCGDVGTDQGGAGSDGGEPTSHAIAYVYDDDGLITRAGGLSFARDAESGFLRGLTLGAVENTIELNEYGEVSSYAARVNGEAAWSWSLERDALGRIDRKTETSDGQTRHFEYAYDEAGRLWQVWEDGALEAEYRYDANGNRVFSMEHGVVVEADYDSQDRLFAWGDLRFEFGAHGDLEARTDLRTGGTTTYRYDALGTLREVVLPDGRHIHYEIDGLGRRVGKSLDGELFQGFLYRGNQVVGVLDEAGRLVQRFVYGTRGHVPDYVVVFEYERDCPVGGTGNGPTERTYRLETDLLGSVRRVVDSETGEVVQRIEYGVWGQVLADSRPGFQPFGFAGGLYDPDTRLVRFGARDYDSEVGRWTARDPIGFGGEDTNLYGYAFGDPVNFIDPNGTVVWFVPVIGAAVGGGANAWSNYGAYSSGQMSAGDYAESIVFGAGLGALTSFAGGGLWGAVLSGGAGAAANSAHNQTLTGDCLDLGEVAESGLWGALGGGAASTLAGIGRNIIPMNRYTEGLLRGTYYYDGPSAVPTFEVPAGSFGLVGAAVTEQAFGSGD